MSSYDIAQKLLNNLAEIKRHGWEPTMIRMPEPYFDNFTREQCGPNDVFDGVPVDKCDRLTVHVCFDCGSAEGRDFQYSLPPLPG